MQLKFLVQNLHFQYLPPPSSVRSHLFNQPIYSLIFFYNILITTILRKSLSLYIFSLNYPQTPQLLPASEQEKKMYFYIWYIISLMCI